jgi:hypothetical protein
MSATFDGQGFVVMTNSGNGSQLASEIALSMAATYGWPYKPRERRAISLSAEDLAKFAGEYDAVQIGRVKVMVIEDHLELSFPVRGNIALYPESADVFFSLISDMPDLRFSKDESGSVTSFTLGSITAKRVK